MESFDIQRLAADRIRERVTPARAVPRQRRRTTLADRLRRVNDRPEN